MAKTKAKKPAKTKTGPKSTWTPTTLTCSKEVMVTVEYGDLEEFITKVYGLKEWSFVADQECGNDSQHSFDVDGKVEEYDLEEIKEFQEKKVQSQFLTPVLLNDCCAKGLIEKGEYLIRVCW